MPRIEEYFEVRGGSTRNGANVDMPETWERGYLTRDHGLFIGDCLNACVESKDNKLDGPGAEACITKHDDLFANMCTAFQRVIYFCSPDAGFWRGVVPRSSTH